jgi:exopolyphosphatase/guanosine-5'-triphosphate,3'-diphosphate pyrophosphatase
MNKIRKSSKSFKIGTVRKLKAKKRKSIFNKILAWIDENTKKLEGPITAVGTGGNINKLYKLSNQKFRSTQKLSLVELKGMRAYVDQYTYDQRISLLNMNPDRADVIIPAADIYINTMKMLGADQIIVPGVGLKDGLLYTLYETESNERLEDVDFINAF